MRSAITSAQTVIPVGQTLIHTEANTKEIAINKNHQYLIFVWMMKDHTENASVKGCGN